MILRGLVDEDFVNYKVPAMFVIFPYCSFKCEKDCGIKCCQNSKVALSPTVEIDAKKLVERFLANPITHAIVCGGLEPLDSFHDVLDLVSLVREKSDVTIVIYTGYTEDEAAVYIDALKKFTNIIVKFGRFVPNQPHRVDEVLGVELASDNQYAKKIS